MSGRFATDIGLFIRKTGIRTETVVRKIAFQVYNGVTLKTPVKTGRARANWLVGINNMPTGVVLGAGGMEGGRSTINGYKLGDIIYIANNLPYIGVLEYGGYPNPPKNGGVNAKGLSLTVGGFSRKAPHGMVGVTMVEIRSNFRKFAEGLS